MGSRSTTAAALLALLALAPLHGATTSPQQAELFSRKVAQIQKQGASPKTTAPIRTALSQDELNSWLAHRAQDRIPAGVSQVQLSLLGQGKVGGQALVDLEVLAKRRSTGGLFDPWAFVGGRVPVTVTGRLRSQNGLANFELEGAEISGVPVPTTMLHELVGFYSKTPRQPEGIRLDDTFQLPANIQQIEVGQGRAVVVQ
jgi:hypothetical protein